MITWLFAEFGLSYELLRTEERRESDQLARVESYISEKILKPLGCTLLVFFHSKLLVFEIE